MTDGWIDLGQVESFGTLPARLSVGAATYHLIRGKEGYKLLSSVCPHQGGTVSLVDSGFECPNHGWTFDERGDCINVSGQPLESFPVLEKDGHLFTRVPEAGTAPAQTSRRLTPSIDCSIQLHSHACVEFKHKGFSLLTDPWLVGPAFLGAWLQYPPSPVDVSQIKPDAIWISHEHSDHFHEPSLKLFDKTTPVYIPDFPNRRMVGMLADLGFSDVRPMAFGETYQVSEDIKLTCFEPGSLWNDSMVLIEIGEFRFLNLNDAGLNQRIAAQVGPVDMIASAFSPGASGYPMTWDHLEDARKTEIMESARQGCIELLKEAMDLYGGRYLLPFAGHFALWHPSHLKYVQLMRKNTVDDILEAFEQTDVTVLNLLPGESWDGPSGEFSRCWDRREELYVRDSFLKRLSDSFDQPVFEAHHPADKTASREAVEGYFLSLNDVPDIIFCDELTVTLRTREIGSDHRELEVAFEIKDSTLTILPEPPEHPNLTIELPGGIMQQVIDENLSWDEVHIGYWCHFSRSPDVYHAGFWRLLQAPYFNRPTFISDLPRKPISVEAIVGDLIEEYGDQADRVLRRYGLYCTGCSHSAWCSIEDSGRIHGVPDTKIAHLTQELNRISA